MSVEHVHWHRWEREKIGKFEIGFPVDGPMVVAIHLLFNVEWIDVNDDILHQYIWEEMWIGS